MDEGQGKGRRPNLRNPIQDTGAAATATAPMPRGLRGLCIFIIGLACLEFVVATTGVQIRELPAHRDFTSYYLAGVLARQHRSPYDADAFGAAARAAGLSEEPFPFLNPPPFALCMQPLARLPYPQARGLWMIAMTLALFGALAITARVVRWQAAALGIESRSFVWVLFAGFVPAALNSTSVHNDIRVGSVGILLFLAFATVSWTLARGRQVLAAVMITVATLAKLSPVVLIPYAWWRAGRRAALLSVLFLAASMLPAIAHWGPDIVVRYWHDALWGAIVTTKGWAHNQSLDAYLLRLFDPSAVRALPQHVPAAERVVSIALGLGIAAATLWVLVARRSPASQRREGHRDNALEGENSFALALAPVEIGALALAALVLMKLTWVHTLAAMLFVWPVLMAVIFRAAERGAPWARRAGIAAAAGFFLSSAHLPVLWGERWSHQPWTALTGAHLAGLLVLWGTCLFVLRRAPGVRSCDAAPRWHCRARQDDD